MKVNTIQSVIFVEFYWSSFGKNNDRF